MQKTTKRPSLSQLVAPIQGLSPAELSKTITDSKVVQGPKSKGDVVVRRLTKTLGKDAVGVVGGIAFWCLRNPEKGAFSSSENFCRTSRDAYTLAPSAVATGII